MANKAYIDGSRVVIADDVTGAIVSVGVIKNGHNNTGYTEPFITPVPITATDSLTADYTTGDLGVGEVWIEATEYGKNEPSDATVNQNLFCVPNDDFTGIDTITTGFCNIKPGFIVFDGTSYLTVESTRTLPTDNNGWPRQEVVFSANVTDLVAGVALFAVGKVLDLGSSVATRDYVAGDLVIEPYVV